MKNISEISHLLHNAICEHLLSSYKTANNDLKNHVSNFLNSENIVSEPIFESNFPCTLSELKFLKVTKTGVFNRDFACALDPQFTYIPYQFQVEAWQWLTAPDEHNSLVIDVNSSADNSILYPILFDLKEQPQDTPQGIKALFLLGPQKAKIQPLNKLVDMCNSIDNANFKCLFDNLLFSEDELASMIVEANTPLSKYQPTMHVERPTPIRKMNLQGLHPNEPIPSILMTTPIMLEELLMDVAYQPAIQQSQGTLKWVIIDSDEELASISGLIKDVITAFGSDINNIQFVVCNTSNRPNHTNFLISFLTEELGISTKRVTTIVPKRECLPLDEDLLSIVIKKVEADLGIAITPEMINLLRAYSLEHQFFNTEDIDKDVLHLQNATLTLKIIEKLSNSQIEEPLPTNPKKHRVTDVLPLRAEYKIKETKGIFINLNTLTNNQLTSPKLAFEPTTEGLWAELIHCNECKMPLFSRETSDNEKIIFAQNDAPISVKTSFSFDQEGKIDSTGTDFIFFKANDYFGCTHCGQEMLVPIKYTLSHKEISSIVSKVIYDKRWPLCVKTNESSFEIEKWANKANITTGNSLINRVILNDIFYNIKTAYDKQQSSISDYQTVAKSQETPIVNIISIDKIVPSLEAISTQLTHKSHFTDSCYDTGKEFFLDTLKSKSNLNSSDNMRALMLQQLGRRDSTACNLENLGMVNLSYNLDTSDFEPMTINGITIDQDEFANLCAIALDFYLRELNVVLLPALHKKLPLNNISPFAICLTTNDSFKKPYHFWPNMLKELSKSGIMDRLVLLLLAGFGYTDKQQVIETDRELIDKLLVAIYNCIAVVFHKGADNPGYIDFFKKRQDERFNKEYYINYSITDNQWICPVKEVFVNRHFKGISPWINGELNEQTIVRYTLTNVEKPAINAFPKEFDGTVNSDLYSVWKTTHLEAIKNYGLMSENVDLLFAERLFYPISAVMTDSYTTNELAGITKLFSRKNIDTLYTNKLLAQGIDNTDVSCLLLEDIGSQFIMYTP